VTLQVRHQSGPKHYEKTSGLYEAAGSNAQVEPFIEDMAAVLVPFPAAVDDHQTRNAMTMVDAGAARLVAEGEGFADRLVAVLAGLCAGGNVVARAHLVVMAEAARTLAKPNAAERIAAACLAEAAA
jgi:UDP-N-acetylglucosamine--N-acetylmuramyl-(pentapeptide) pyrophosphoryl-undecaprenol N-acetylglucosamine transferase